jgi:diaminopropionate ammonia-lyase
VLAHLADGYITLEEDQSPRAMRLLANPSDDDPAVVAGESGCTGVAALLAAMSESSTKEAMGLGPSSRVLVINSEGATDAAIYAQIVGRKPQEIG